MSCYSEEGVMNVRNTACDHLLQARVEMKMSGSKINDVINKIHLAMPTARDTVARLPNIPDGALNRVKYDPNDPNRPKLAKDIEAENGGAGVYNVNLKDKYLLADEEWKQDVIPEFWEGHNVADFIDPDIEEKLDALEREEERLEQEGFYDVNEPMLDSDEEDLKNTADAIRERKKLIIQAHRLEHNRNRAILPKKSALKNANLKAMGEKLSKHGLDPNAAVQSTRALGKKRSRSETEADEAVKEADADIRDEVMAREMSNLGFRNVKQKREADKQKKLIQTQSNKFGKRGESDRAIQTKMPKHLFSGKTSMGSRDRR